MRRLLLLGLVLAVLGSAGVLAGCGGASGSPTGEALSFEQLSQAARSSADASSGRFAFSVDITIPDAAEDFSFGGEGSFDGSSNRAHVTLDLSSLAQMLGGFLRGLGEPGADAPDFNDPSAWQIAAVQDGDVMYVRVPAMSAALPAGKSWVRTAVDDASQGLGLFQEFTRNDPRKMLGLLRAAAGEIETVGSEELRGVATTHYRATLSLDEYENLVPESERAEERSMVTELVQQAGLAEMPVEVWLDENGLVRKVEMSVFAKDPESDHRFDGSVMFELWDYGRAVEVEPPPADEVVDASALG